MAFTVTPSTNTGSGVSLAITKPSGLAVGDLMLAQFTVSSAAATITPPSGFVSTQANTASGSPDIKSEIFWKIADSGDVAASDFTFSQDQGSQTMKGGILRITGHKTSAPITTDSGQGNTSSATVTAPTVTPTTANSLIVFFTTNDSGGTASTYALATSSPSFSEQYDLDGGAIGASCATGTRSQVTATGNGTATLDGGAAVNIGQLIVIEPEQIISIADTATVTDTSSAVRGRVASISETVTVTDDVENTKSRAWDNQTKNPSTWTNQQIN